MILFCRMLYLHAVWNSSHYTKAPQQHKRALNPSRGCLAVVQAVLFQVTPPA